MGIDRHQVEHIARLARLKLSEEEIVSLSGELSDIVSYIERLKELKTEGVEPTSHVLDLSNVMRPDQHRPSLSADDALANAPDRSGGFYRVPKIIEQ